MILAYGLGIIAQFIFAIVLPTASIAKSETEMQLETKFAKMLTSECIADLGKISPYKELVASGALFNACFMDAQEPLMPKDRISSAN